MLIFKFRYLSDFYREIVGYKELFVSIPVARRPLQTFHHARKDVEP